jgi:hypothetical protein
MKLEEIIGKYGVPDPKLVGKLPRGGQSLDFVGHADVTKMLIEIDPEWTWEPVAFDVNGLPAYRVENGMAHMAGWMTILGVRRLGIGSVMHNKPDLLKELCSDFLRNASMRYGICLSLWTKQEWDDVAHTPSIPVARPVQTKPAPSYEEVPPPTDADYKEDSVIKNIIYDIYPAYEGGDNYLTGYNSFKKILSEINVENIFKLVDNGRQILQSYIDILEVLILM